MTWHTAVLLYALGFFIYGACALRHHQEDEARIVVAAVAAISLAWPFFLADDVHHWWKQD